MPAPLLSLWMPVPRPRPAWRAFDPLRSLLPRGAGLRVNLFMLSRSHPRATPVRSSFFSSLKVTLSNREGCHLRLHLRRRLDCAEGAGGRRPAPQLQRERAAPPGSQKHESQAATEARPPPGSSESPFVKREGDTEEDPSGSRLAALGRTTGSREGQASESGAAAARSPSREQV